MASWEEMLLAVVQAARERRRWEQIERTAKDALLLAHQLTNPESNVYPMGDATIVVKSRTNVKVHRPDELTALLGKRGYEVLEPSAKKVWALLSKEPSLMAKVIAAGAISLTTANFVEVALKEQSATEEETRRALALGESGERYATEVPVGSDKEVKVQ